MLLVLVIGGEVAGVITRERTSGTGIAAEARMEGSRPPSSTCVFADSTRSSPCGRGDNQVTRCASLGAARMERPHRGDK